MKYGKIVKGIFDSRPNRFVAKVYVDGILETVHVKNTGRCKELLVPGVEVLLEESDNPNRKTKYDLVMVYKKNFGLINMDSQAPNKVVQEWLEQQDYSLVKPEYTYGNSRIDFYLERENSQTGEIDRYLVEVKGCTLEREGVGYFPDAPTERGVKHLRELAKAAREGYHAVVAFVIQMEGVTEVRPNIEMQKEFGDALEEAKQAGVNVAWLRCKVTEESLVIVSQQCFYKKVIIVPDSFKGSMSSFEVAQILKKQLEDNTNYWGKAFPVADGGEGSIDCVLSVVGGEKRKVLVKSPEWKEIEASYGVTTDQKGLIEFAESSGLTKQTSFAAMKATSYGFGQLIIDALDYGIRDFVLCLGGSATTDGACGMAAALGVEFRDTKGEIFVPVGESLKDICQIDLEKMDSRIKECSFEVMCDVENPLFGEKGASFVYAGQKGASEEEKILLDQGLRHFCEVLKQTLQVDYSEMKGGGAAGGAGCGCVAFLGATLKNGIDIMLDLCQFDREIEDCDWIVTGEGKLDQQSLMGKVLSGLQRRAKGVPIVSFCGICDLEESQLVQNEIEAVEIGRDIPVSEAMKNGATLLEEKSKTFFKKRFGRKKD